MTPVMDDISFVALSRTHGFLTIFDWTQNKMLMSAKGPVYFQILSCCFINVELKLLCVKLALN